MGGGVQERLNESSLPCGFPKSSPSPELSVDRFGYPQNWVV